MSLPGIFEVFQLAIGPSTALTTGSLRIGQAFREDLQASPFRSHYRLLIELAGGFAKHGHENFSDQAVVAGLGGFTIEQSSIAMQTFYEKIKETGYFSFFGEVWPFNPESDLVFNNTEKIPAEENVIRFHLISKSGQPVFQKEYSSSINGTAISWSRNSQNQPEVEGKRTKFDDITAILRIQNISMLDYITATECSKYQISPDHFKKRMIATWKLMMANTDRGLKSLMSSLEVSKGKAYSLNQNYLEYLATTSLAGGDPNKAAIYAMALSEEVINHHKLITAPTCSGSIVVPAVLRHLQEKFLFTDEKMADSLTISGLFGSLILDRLSRSTHSHGMQSEIISSAIMAAAGATYLMGGSIPEIAGAATMTAILLGNSHQESKKFDSELFILKNSMTAQTLPALIDLAKIQPAKTIPSFDNALDYLFPA
jgi:L-serine deaminase